MFYILNNYHFFYSLKQLKAFLKIFLLISVFLFSIFPVFSESRPYDSRNALGIGIEWNMNANSNHTGALALAYDFNFGKSSAFGVNMAACTNFSGFTAIQPAVMYRWYIWGIESHTGIFMQADIGAYIMLLNVDVFTNFLAGLRAGYRISLGSMFYLEPYIKAGYPFMIGIGVTAGLRF